MNLIDTNPTTDNSALTHSANAIVIDRYGYILQKDKNGKRVLLCEDNKTTLLGELGGEIQIDYIYSNLLQRNGKAAKAMWSPFKFRNLVKTRGEWDLKNNKKTIFGLANGSATVFLYKDSGINAQDIGNHHFGYISKAFGLFPEEFILRQAGRYQIRAGTSKPEWQRKETIDYMLNANPMSAGPVVQHLLPPYGDNPRDQLWIQKGFDEYKKIRKGKSLNM
ncbi:MAG: hypothetical protein J5641_02545 [Bacteroidales bacterium]|nr:hypothetical protein [Bacteroidales bacterium]